MKNIKLIILLVLCLLIVFSQETIAMNYPNKSNSSDWYSVLKDWQTLIAAVIVILGWFVNSYLNKKHEITKRRIDKRLEVLQSIIESILFEVSKNADKAFTQKDFKDKLERARAKIQMFGYKKEIQIYEDFIDSLNMKATTEEEKNVKLKRINESMARLPLMKDSLRSELGLEANKR